MAGGAGACRSSHMDSTPANALCSLSVLCAFAQKFSVRVCSATYTYLLADITYFFSIVFAFDRNQMSLGLENSDNIDG